MSQAQAPAKTVYQMIRDAVDKGDHRFHRRMDAYWLKQYVAGASDFDKHSEEEWDRYAEATREMVTRIKSDKINAAMQIIGDSVNGDDKDLLIDAMRRVHPYLFNEVIMAGIETIKKHHMLDGRIAPMFKKMAEDNFL